MENVVFLFGAGASAQAGAPMMRGFLDEAERLSRPRNLKDDQIHFDRVFKGIDQLQGVFSKSVIDTDNLESVYTAFELAILLGKLGNLPSDEVAQLSFSMRRLIVRTLEATVNFPVKNGQITAPVPYDQFCDLLRALRDSNYQGSITLMTFNYDLALDFALYNKGVVADYCLSGSSSGEGVKLLKLHGSMNWIPVADKDEIHPWQFRDFFSRFSWSDLNSVKNVRLDLLSKIPAYIAANPGIHLKPDVVIVPPTLAKQGHYSTVGNVWKAAAKALSSAEEIYIIGYSLPQTDLFFNHLFALGSMGTTRIKRLIVYNPDTSGGVHERFKSMLGPTTLRRFEYKPYRFGGADFENRLETAMANISLIFKGRHR